MKRHAMALLGLGLAGGILALAIALRRGGAEITTAADRPEEATSPVVAASVADAPLSPAPPERGRPMVVSFDGPVRSRAAAELAAAGARVLGAPGGFALLAEISEAALPAVRTVPSGSVSYTHLTLPTSDLV